MRILPHRINCLDYTGYSQLDHNYFPMVSIVSWYRYKQFPIKYNRLNLNVNICITLYKTANNFNQDVSNEKQRNICTPRTSIEIRFIGQTWHLLKLILGTVIIVQYILQNTVIIGSTVNESDYLYQWVEYSSVWNMPNLKWLYWYQYTIHELLLIQTYRNWHLKSIFIFEQYNWNYTWIGLGWFQRNYSQVQIKYLNVWWNSFCDT